MDEIALAQAKRAEMLRILYYGLAAGVVVYVLYPPAIRWWKARHPCTDCDEPTAEAPAGDPVIEAADLGLEEA